MDKIFYLLFSFRIYQPALIPQGRKWCGLQRYFNFLISQYLYVPSQYFALFIFSLVLYRSLKFWQYIIFNTLRFFVHPVYIFSHTRSGFESRWCMPSLRIELATVQVKGELMVFAKLATKTVLYTCLLYIWIFLKFTLVSCSPYQVVKPLIQWNTHQIAIQYFTRYNFPFFHAKE